MEDMNRIKRTLAERSTEGAGQVISSQEVVVVLMVVDARPGPQHIHDILQQTDLCLRNVNTEELRQHR